MKFFSVAVAAVSALTFSADKNRPVSKVITLLKDMQKQLQADVEADQEIYDKMACWCKTNDAEKTKAIADAEQRITQLTAEIEELTANSARLNTEIKNLEKEIAANQEALDKATALREKQLAEFNAEEKDMLSAIGALKSAITVLSKHHTNEESLLSVAALVKSTTRQYSSLLSASQHAKAKKLVGALLQGPAHLQAYAPQSGEIFGILGNMKDTFEANLSDSQKEEQANQKAFEDLKAAKEAEIKAGQEQLDKKTDELASTDERNAQAKEDIEDTRNTLSADEAFLMDLKEKCQMTDQEFEERQKTRNEEIQAVSEALAVLASDDAHDTFTRTFNFLQRFSGKREKAAAVLSAAAKKLHTPKLATLATAVKLDAFTKVKQAIDDMVAQLLKEKEDEIKHRDWCIDSLHDNESETERKNRDKSDLEAKIDTLASQIATLSSEIENLEKQIAETQVQLKRAGENREKENAEFQKTVADQRETQRLLTQALNVLKGFYAKKAGTALAQQPAGPPPPAGFDSYKNNAGAGGVMAMIQQIVTDAKAMEAEALRGESDAQKAYESFVKESNNSVETMRKEIVNKSEARATAEGDKTQTETEHESTVTELEQLANENADMHRSCDFVLKNFDVRQEARDQEVEALRQAKAILSGAKF
jgi:chromosome segregation ATPase